ncbi:EB1 protein, putative [Acanthamoeba castellanii str. Neff]|uniref:EB1 protein, putative n=1 Tax=Acanthamoeba castellanii (strain ATCC 30010 / Neff) TaxID=1257118 RepID=L8H278_ACACF|nr:EB1 protein, putative [Acanthamoeba castellanii str. Neff]ELR19350.1 EB1 protein, putative [Acanthamoeba castellanii str. Neff]
MEGLYFTGRKELLEWINGFLEIEYTKVEQVASAAAFCQLMDALHPGTIALSKVRFNANQEWEFVSNFKLLQKAFDAANIKKHIDVPKLIRAKYQDNLEFLQWFKRYFEGKWDKAEYRAKERRLSAMKAAAGPARRVSIKPAQPVGQAKPPVKRVAKRRVTMAASSIRATTPEKPVTVTPAAPAKKTSPVKRAVAASPVTRSAAKPLRPASILKKPVSVAAPVNGDVASFVERQVDTLKNDLFQAVASLQRERDVFSEKLKAIKMMCEEDESSAETIQRILTIIRIGTDEEDQPQPQPQLEQAVNADEDEDDGLDELDELDDIIASSAQQPETDDGGEEAPEATEDAGDEIADDDEDLDFV